MGSRGWHLRFARGSSPVLFVWANPKKAGSHAKSKPCARPLGQQMSASFASARAVRPAKPRLFPLLRRRRDLTRRSRLRTPVSAVAGLEATIRC